MQFKPYTKILHEIISVSLVLIIVLCSLSFYPRSVYGFIPMQWQNTLLFTPLSRSHETITTFGVEKYAKELFGLPRNGRLSESTNKAIKELVVNNAKVDNPKAPTFGISANHVDGENFSGAHTRLVQLKSVIKLFLDINAPAAARNFLGSALHTVQDAYSHSNWVELAAPNTTPSPIPRFGEIGFTFANTLAALRTCTDCARNDCDDCYDPDRTPPLNNLIASGLTTLTSGYYLSSNPNRPVEDKRKPHRFKCSHGGKVLGEFDKSGNGDISNGINKDTRDCTISPHFDKHNTAARVAEAATIKYLKELESLVGKPKMKLLLGGSPTMAFVVDTTGSMFSEIASVRQQILQIIDRRISINLPTRYILMPFNDPFVGPIISTDDPNVFRTAVNNLTASGGDDCPELAYTGLYRTLEEMDIGGSILMFTDADAKDEQLSGSVRALAREKHISIYNLFSVGDGCGFGFGYFDTASGTGGSFFRLSSAETGALTNLADFFAMPNATQMFSAIGNLSTTSQIFTIPVDSTLSRATFSISGPGGSNVILRRPDGSAVSGSDPNVTYISLLTGLVVSVPSPVAGAWSVTINGSSQTGNLGVNVTGESNLSLTSFDFTEFIGSQHGGNFPLAGAPISGQEQKVLLNVAAEDASTVQVQLRNPDGSVLQNVNLPEVVFPPDDDPDPIQLENKQYAGSITVPGVPFQVYVTGQDDNGMAYTRLIPGIITPQTVKINPISFQDLYPGQTTTFTLEVKNFGPAGTFNVTGTDGKEFIQTMSPTTVSLATGETRNITVTVKPPTNTTGGTTDTFTFAVTHQTTPNITNQTIVGPVTVQDPPFLNVGVTSTVAVGGNGDAFIDPGEGGALTVQLINPGATEATDISAMLSAKTAGITISAAESTYSNIAPGANGINNNPFVFYLPSNASCGQKVDLTLAVTATVADQTVTSLYDLSVQTGQASFGSAITASYTGPPVPIPDGDVAGVNIPLQVTGFSGFINDLNFRIDGTSCTTTEGATTVGLDHTWVSDLVLRLISPSGTTVRLINRTDGSANNFCNTVLDDEASGISIQSVSGTNAPFSGTFKPAESLGLFDGENPNGTWTLNVSDNEAFDVGNVRAFSLVLSPVQYSCNVTPADTTAPSLTDGAFNQGPPTFAEITAQDSQSGLSVIRLLDSENVDVQVASFTPGSTSSVVVRGTLIDSTQNGFFEVEAVDVAGNVSSRSRTVPGSGSPPIVILADDFNDNSLNTLIWTANDLFSGFIDLNIPLNETSQQLEIGPLLQNTSGSHYRGIRTVSSYDFTGASSYVELIQAPSPTTAADAMFTIGYSVDNYYRIYVSAGNLIGLKKIGGVKTTLFTLSYNSMDHRFLRIRHDSGNNSVVFETAPRIGAGPGTWVQRYTAPWNSSVQLEATQFEMKAGTWQAEANPPGKVVFDNFVFALSSPAPTTPIVAMSCPNSGSTNGGDLVEIHGNGFLAGATVNFGGSLASNVNVTSTTTITATTPAHAAGVVNVSVTNTNGQTGTLNNGFTYQTPSPNVILQDNFDDDCLNTFKWMPNDLFSGFVDLGLPIVETGQRLEIGPLLQNVSGSHYRGIRTVSSYDFTGAYSYVELVQPASAATAADAMLTVGYSVDNYYRLYVSGGNLIGQKKISGVKTTLFTLSYDSLNHRYLRIRHDSTTNSVVLETAPSNGAGPGVWVQRHIQPWNSLVQLSTIQLELKGGTWQAEINAPGKVIFDNFLLAR